ncbi:MAG: CpXC domain-containing protein [Chloroflexi bacterium]|nr:CpXC domain-containing protein [Chloroflexota bacterium]
MFRPITRQVACPSCRQPFAAQIEQIIDGGRDPRAKARLLSGQINVVRCPYCGYEFRLATPILYHDASKELLLVNVPMELGLPLAEQERVIGSLTQAIINSLPQEQRKGYLLMPRSTLTLQGMIETILEADGITREMLEARLNKLRLAEQFLQTDPAQWGALAQQHDSALDEEFFALLGASAEAALQDGRRDLAQAMLALRDQLLSLSSTGQRLMSNVAAQEALIQAVASDLNALGNQVSREKLLDLAIRYAQEEKADKLEVLVGLARPVMDYIFFQQLTARLEAADAPQRTLLSKLREQLLTLTQAVDQQSQALVQQAAQTLQTIVNSSDVDAAIRSRLDLIDDVFISVLSANIQNAEQRGDAAVASRLREVMERTMTILQEDAPPAVRFVNELLLQPSAERARELLAARAAEFGRELLDVMTDLLNELSARGHSAALERLIALRQMAAEVLGDLAMQDGAPSDSAPKPPLLDSKSAERKSGIILPFSARKRARDD